MNTLDFEARLLLWINQPGNAWALIITACFAIGLFALWLASQGGVA